MVSQRLTNAQSVQTRRKRWALLAAIVLCILLCGFSWGVSFWGQVLFPFQDAIDLDMITDYGSIVNAEQLQTYLDNADIADEIVAGVQANLAGNVYQIEIPEFHDEPLGVKMVRIIADRLFS